MIWIFLLCIVAALIWENFFPNTFNFPNSVLKEKGAINEPSTSASLSAEKLAYINSTFVRSFSVATSGSYTFTVVNSNIKDIRDYDFFIYAQKPTITYNGNFDTSGSLDSSTNTSSQPDEELTISLTANTVYYFLILPYLDNSTRPIQILLKKN